MLTGHDGTQYIPASDVQHERGYGDVTPELLRSWVSAGHLRVVTVAELADSFRRPLDAGDPTDAPARWPGPSGPENLYRWRDVVRAETTTRMHRRRHPGRRRAAFAHTG